MSRGFGIGFGLAALVIIALVWSGFISTKGNHLAPDGWISNVRAQQLSPEMIMLVIDFGILNDSDIQMTARRIDPYITTAQGQEVHGVVYAAADMAKTSKFYPKLGPMIHPVLPLRGNIEPRKTANLMIGAGFEIDPAVFASRQSITLEIEDVTGPVVKMVSK